MNFQKGGVTEPMEEEDKKGYIIGSDNKTGSNPDLTEEGGGDRKAKEKESKDDGLRRK